jgi:hypothetical protein
MRNYTDFFLTANVVTIHGFISCTKLFNSGGGISKFRRGFGSDPILLSIPSWSSGHRQTDVHYIWTSILTDICYPV